MLLCLNNTMQVEAAVRLIEESCIFPPDNMLLKRIAKVATNYGESNADNGGIWQVGYDDIN